MSPKAGRDVSNVSPQWNGKTCNKDEKFKAVQYLQTLKVMQTKYLVMEICIVHKVSRTVNRFIMHVG